MADPLTQSLEDLRFATKKRAHTKLIGHDLESLDEKLCLAGRKVFLRYVDAAGVFERPDKQVTQECLKAMRKALNSLASSTDPTYQYKRANRYSDSVREKVVMLSRIADATSVQTVLHDRVASLFGEDATNPVG